jgi:hypothetical protein
VNAGIADDAIAEVNSCFLALSPEVFQFAMSLTRGERALAEDLVQDAFVQAIDRWAELRHLESRAREALSTGRDCDRQSPAADAGWGGGPCVAGGG